MPTILPEMKRALPLLIALALPLVAFADDPADPVVPASVSGDPTPTGKTGEPVGYTVVPLGEVKVISLQEMMKSGGLITSENFSDPKHTAKKKKKKKRPIPPAAAIGAGILGIAAAGTGGHGGNPAPVTTTLDDRAPQLPGSTITRAVVSPEPGSAALCLLLLPVAVGYFRTRSKNA